MRSTPTFAALAGLALPLLPLAVAFLAACGGGTPPANDQTTVTVEKPADSSTPAPAPAPSK